jgi:hypothetical protein
MPSRQEKKRRKFLYLQQRFPDQCFCENKTYLETEIVEKIKMSFESPYSNDIREIEVIVYKCSQCNRKYDDRPAIAA